MIPEAELERLASVRARTQGLVGGLSQEELDRRPRRGGWSVGEVLDHLLKAEAGNRGDIAGLIALARSGRQPFLHRGLSELDISPAFVPQSVVPLLAWPASFATLLTPACVREAVIRNRVFPARTSRALEPRPGRPAAELRAELASSVAETRTLLEANPDLDYRRMIHQHPFLGANDVPQILRLTAAHEERHQDQIQEVLAGSHQAAPPSGARWNAQKGG